MALSKERKAELAADLQRLKEMDQAMHACYPPGGNANHEKAQVLLNDRIREIRAELGLKEGEQ